MDEENIPNNVITNNVEPSTLVDKTVLPACSTTSLFLTNFAFPSHWTHPVHVRQSLLLLLLLAR